MKPLILLTYLLSALFIKGFAQVYQYHPQLALEIGHGVDITNLDVSKNSLFDSIIEKPEVQTTTTTRVEQSVLFNTKDVIASVNLNSALNARYLGYNLESKFSLSTEKLTSSTSFTLVFKAISDFGKYSIDLSKSPYTNEVKELITNKEWESIVNRYGTHYVAAVRKGCMLNVYLTFTGFSEQEKKAWEASLNGSAKFAAGGADLQIKLTNLIQTKSSSGQLLINILSSGDTSGFKNLKNLILNYTTSENPLNEITKTISDYAGQFSNNNAPITAYYLGQMTNLGVPTNLIEWNNTIDNYLEQYFQTYLDMDLKIQDIDKVLESKYFELFSTTSDKVALKELKTTYSNNLLKILDSRDKCLHMECGYDSSFECCILPNLEYPNEDLLDSYLNNPLVKSTWKVNNMKHYIPDNGTFGDNIADTIESFDVQLNGLKDRTIQLSINLNIEQEYIGKEFQYKFEVYADNKLIATLQTRVLKSGIPIFSDQTYIESSQIKVPNSEELHITIVVKQMLQREVGGTLQEDDEFYLAKGTLVQFEIIH